MAHIAELLDGFKRFFRQYFNGKESIYTSLYEDGQDPKTLVIACSDSRVDPSIITDAKPGDIFVIRNIANLIPTYDPRPDNGLHGISAALEFAVRVLKVSNVVVMGHSDCAGIKTLLTPEILEQTDFIYDWVKIASDAKAKVDTKLNPQQQRACCEKEAILLSMHNLLTFPWIKEKVMDEELKIHGWYFCIKDGSLSIYDPLTKSFERIKL